MSSADSPDRPMNSRIVPAESKGCAGEPDGVITSSTVPADRITELRAQMKALANVGTTPTSTQLRSFLRQHRVTADELDVLTVPVEHDPVSVAAPPARAKSDGAADEPATDVWVDPQDPFAVHDPKPPRVREQRARGIEVAAGLRGQRLVSDLLDDHERTGRLRHNDVVALARRRGLDAHELEEVMDDLAEAGVDLDDEVAEPGYDGRNDLDGGKTRQQIGSVERDQLAAYLTQAGKIALVTAPDEVRLGSAISAGQQADELLDLEASTGKDRPRLREIARAGRQAHQQLVRANLRLVVSIARHPRYAYGGVELSDRIQDGNMGLLRAADKFDATLGYKFSTYATWWIRQQIERGIADRGRLVRLPVHYHEQVQRARSRQWRLQNQLGRPATLDELASDLQEDPGTVAALLAHTQQAASLDAPLSFDQGLTLGDLLAGNEEVDARRDPIEVVLATELQRELELVMRCSLSERDRTVLTRRYGLGESGESETLQAIAADVGLTRERVRQIANSALKKLRARPEAAALYEYLVQQGPDVDVIIPPILARPSKESID